MTISMHSTGEPPRTPPASALDFVLSGRFAGLDCQSTAADVESTLGRAPGVTRRRTHMTLEYAGVSFTFVRHRLLMIHADVTETRPSLLDFGDLPCWLPEVVALIERAVPARADGAARYRIERRTDIDAIVISNGMDLSFRLDGRILSIAKVCRGPREEAL